MKLIRLVCPVILIFLYLNSFSQITYLPEGSKEYQLMERLEIKQGKFNNLIYSSVKPFSRKAVVKETEYADSLAQTGGVSLSKVDRYNLQSALMDNSEWVTSADTAAFRSKHPLWNTFFKTPPNFFEVNQKDFFLVVNPVIYFQAGGGNDGTKNML